MSSKKAFFESIREEARCGAIGSSDSKQPQAKQSVTDTAKTPTVKKEEK